MVWGCILAEGPGYLCQINGNMDQDMYKGMLSEHLVNSMNYYNVNKKKNSLPA
jgi:hypothetical protein